MLLCSYVQFDDRTKVLVPLLRRVLAVSFAPPQHHLDKAARDVDDQNPLRNTDTIATNLRRMIAQIPYVCGRLSVVAQDIQLRTVQFPALRARNSVSACSTYTKCEPQRPD